MSVESVAKDDFAIAGKQARIAKCALWIAAFLTAAGLFFGDHLSSFPFWEEILVIQAILLCAYLLLNLGSSLSNFKARKTKINDLIDNSFNTEIANHHSENYYDNEEIRNGTMKLLYNTAESCFFSYREMQSMKYSECTKALIPLGILIVGLIVNKAEVIMAIFRISAIMIVTIQVIRFFVTLSQLKNLLDRMLYTLKHKSSSVTHINAESINYALEYETLMIWYGVKIPDRVYYAMNENLTLEWNEAKKKFAI